MKKIYLLLLCLSALFANDNTDSKSLQKKHLQEQIEKEKKYSKEQKFYMGNEYNLKSFEVDKDSLKNIPEQPDYNEDFDMNNVYD